MIDIVHLLDDFGMGGVARALTLFERPELSAFSRSRVVAIRVGARVAPALNADVIIDHMAISWSRLLFLASLRARNPDARIVHIEHSYTRAFEEHDVTAKARFRAMLKIAARMVDDVVCVSKAQHEWLARDVGLPNAKLHMIYPWSGRDELNEVADPSPRGEAPLHLLAYGRYSSEKNFVALIEAAASFGAEQLQLTLFGSGPDLEALVQLASHANYIQVMPPCTDPGRYLATCDAVIIPSKREAFGLVATEARMAGRAIVVADVDGLPEQVGSAGLITPMRNVDDIVAAIELAMGAPLVEMGRAGRIEVASQHRNIIENWIAFLTQFPRKNTNRFQSRQSPLGGAMA
jgi:glycosyltransferase involved in cell wall biosynthesis